MRIAYLDCASGISGDMMLAALIDAGANLIEIQQQIHSLQMELASEVKIEFSETHKRDFCCGKISITHPPQHAHRHLSEINKIIATSKLTDAAKASATKLFQAIGEAEASVHGVEIEKVHFHEVGAIDSIVDILGVAIAIDQLKIDRFVSSAVPTGSGTIKIAHGSVSVPAPATALLLKGIPIVAMNVQGELTTPTGAAFLKVLVDEFGPVPSMRLEAIGVGCGTKDFDSHANILRVMIGGWDHHGVSDNLASKQTEVRFPNAKYETDTVVELRCNLDDVCGEIIGRCIELMRRGGALDVWTSAIQMKKDRPGTMLCALAKSADVRVMEEIIFMETRTLGIRRQEFQRTKLPRRIESVKTEFGEIAVKIARLPDGSDVSSPEYDQCLAAADKAGVSLQTVFDSVKNRRDMLE